MILVIMPGLCAGEAVLNYEIIKSGNMYLTLQLRYDIILVRN